MRGEVGDRVGGLGGGGGLGGRGPGGGPGALCLHLPRVCLGLCLGLAGGPGTADGPAAPDLRGGRDLRVDVTPHAIGRTGDRPGLLLRLGHGARDGRGSRDGRGGRDGRAGEVGGGVVDVGEDAVDGAGNGVGAGADVRAGAGVGCGERRGGQFVGAGRGRAERPCAGDTGGYHDRTADVLVHVCVKSFGNGWRFRPESAGEAGGSGGAGRPVPPPRDRSVAGRRGLLPSRGRQGCPGAVRGFRARRCARWCRAGDAGAPGRRG